jgi:transcriptional regulator with XRE-family HTH domain
MQPSEVDRILELLEALIVLRKIRLRDLEQTLGMSAGTLRRILNGRIELKIRHIAEILAALDMPMRTFFKIAYETDDVAQAHGQLAHAHRMAQFESHPVTFTPSELEAVIVATIGRLGLGVHPPEAQQDARTLPLKAQKPQHKGLKSSRQKAKPQEKKET